MAQYVYTMNRVSKVVPPKREILKNISLSFFPGAKIGVLGLNGAGKSTLSVEKIKSAQARLDEVYAAYAEPDADFDALAAEQAKLEAVLQVSDAHNLENQLERAADALRLPPPALICCCWMSPPTI